jgi:hypothetical protein
MRKRAITKEMKVAKQLADMLNDITLDLDMVGKYLALHSTSSQFNRIQLISEVAQFEKESQYDREHINALF